MDFLDLQNLVTYWVDDLQFGYFTPPQVQRFLNNAQQQVQKYLVDAGQNWYLTCAQTYMVVNQPDYALPADLLEINRLEYISSGIPPNEITEKIKSITLNQSDLYPFTVGSPAGYYLRKNKLVLCPAPDTPYLLRCHYTYQVSDMINNIDIPDVPAQFHEMIAILAAIDCYIKDGRDSSLLQPKKDQYMEELKRLADRRTQDGPRMVVSSGDGGYGALF